MHGTDVVYSSVYTQRIREQLLKMDVPQKNTPLSRAKWEENIRAIYGTSAEGVIALQDKMGWYDEDRFPVYSAKWAEIKEVLAEAPSADDMLSYIASIGLDLAEFDTLYGREKIDGALKFAKDLKDRYSVLWMYYDLLVS